MNILSFFQFLPSCGPSLAEPQPWPNDWSSLFIHLRTSGEPSSSIGAIVAIQCPGWIRKQSRLEIGHSSWWFSLREHEVDKRIGCCHLKRDLFTLRCKVNRYCSQLWCRGTHFWIRQRNVSIKVIIQNHIYMILIILQFNWQDAS